MKIQNIMIIDKKCVELFDEIIIQLNKNVYLFYS